MLDEILTYFDRIQLTEEQIAEVIKHLEKYEEQETESAKKNERSLNEKLNLTQERISKLIDMHIDGKIDAETYHFKLEQYKKEQQGLIFEIKSYNTDSKIELIAAKQVLDLARRAKDIFLSSKLDEKQQLLGFFFSNLSLKADKLHVELREPFKTLSVLTYCSIWGE